jgi:ubiquinone/menaquinone biosynthesis C-methylase UbiE
MPNNYNKIAKYYDLISRLVYGKAIVEAQVSLLQFIPANSSVFFVGGGTGWVLEELAKIHPEGLIITYVELSSKMIALAQKKDSKDNQVIFINEPIENYISEENYDVILTAFLFDNFREEKIKTVFGKLNSMLRNGGLWLFADFVDDNKQGKWWQRFLLKAMYLFFRIACNIEAQQLINMDVYFGEGYDKLFEARFYGRFIKAAAYKKVY